MQASPSGTTTIDMSAELLRILQNFLLQIMVGANLNSMSFSMICRKDSKEPFAPREMKLYEAIDLVFE